LDQGTVEESGSHGDLLNSNGHYAKMWREQRAAEDNETPKQ
jgi:ABC-type multidrug transport system fused ATPase/permease subunit